MLINKKSIEQYLEDVKAAVRNNRYRIDRNKNRLDNLNLFTDYLIDEAKVHFAPPGGHRCVCQRTLGGGNGQRFNQLLSVQSLRCSVSSRA